MKSSRIKTMGRSSILIQIKGKYSFMLYNECGLFGKFRQNSENVQMKEKKIVLLLNYPCQVLVHSPLP